ncbi:MAG: Rho termination factor N-terminal domain-containing protein, partial [Thermomonas sp.]
MSDPTNDAGEPAAKRVRKPRVAKTATDTPSMPTLPEPAAAAPKPAASKSSESRPSDSKPVEARPAEPRHETPAQASSDHTARGNADQAPHTDGNTGGGDNRHSGQADNQGGQGGESQRNDGQRNNNNRRDRFKNRRDRQRDRYQEGGMPDEGGNGETFVPRPHPQVPEGFPQYSLGDLKRMPAHKLLEIADQLQISEGVARARKQDIIFGILKVLTRHAEGVAADGVLEILPDGFGFLRAAEASYLAGPDDTYISPSQIRRFNLRTGDHLSGRIRWPKDGERYFALSVVDTINGEPIEASKNKTLFENLTPLFPRKKFKLERGDGSSEDITGRILDLMAPQGKGQRALIVSPPKAGKTMMMQQIASAITYNHPDVHLIVLLIDERPE